MIVICIEGPDGTGKSTQVKRVAERLRWHGFKTYSSDVPFEGITKKIVYWMLDNGGARRFPITFQMIHFLNRLHWQVLRYKALSTLNSVAVLGRWTMSSYIYGKLEGLPQWLLRLMRSMMLAPDYTFVMIGSNKGHDRTDDCYEGNISMQDALKDEYLDQVIDTKNAYVVNADMTIDEVTNEIVRILNERNCESMSLPSMLGYSWIKII